jgi:hypothetical protein
MRWASVAFSLLVNTGAARSLFDGTFSFRRTSTGFSGIVGREINFKNGIWFRNCDISYVFLHTSLEYSSKMYGFFPQKAMGYGLCESMGYGTKIPANQRRILKILWVIIEYGF